MTISAHTGETRHGLPLCELRNEARIVAKLYPNEAGDKIRIAVPTLKSFKQVKIDIDSHYIEVDL